MKTLIFLLIFIFSLSSSEVEDDFMATLVRAKRAKVHKVTADVTSSYHDAIKTKLLAKLGRKPYVVPVILLGFQKKKLIYMINYY